VTVGPPARIPKAICRQAVVMSRGETHPAVDHSGLVATSRFSILAKGSEWWVVGVVAVA
jgi:hypothetical protein